MADVENNPVNFTSAFCDLVAVEDRKQFRLTLWSAALLTQWRQEWSQRNS